MNVSNPKVRLGQRNFLKMVLGGTKKESCLPECLFLWGPANSGKTHILNESLRKSSIDKRIEINCCEIMCGRRGFFDSILRQIKYEPESDDQLENIGRCDTLLTFTQQLSQYLHTDKSVIFIIDRPEFLFEQGCGDIFLILRNLRSYVQRHLCCIFTSRLPWSSFAQMTQCQAPIELQFPQYTSDESFTDWISP